jgi:PAS domain S-box-containing protein
MKRARLSVTVTVIVALVTVVTLFLGTLGVGNFQSFQAREYEQLQKEVEYSAEQLAVALALPIWNFDQQQIDSMLDSAMKRDPLAALVLVRDGDAPGVAQTRARSENWDVLRCSVVPAQPDLAPVERAVVVGKRFIGSIRVYASTRFIKQRLEVILVRTAVSILIINVLLIFSLYYILWRTLLRPLQHIESFANAAGSDIRVNGGQGLQGKQFSGELESLRLAIEGMVSLLAKRLAGLQEQSEQLALQEQSAKLNELRVAQILTASPLPITVANLNTGAYIRVNPAWERQFQYPEDEVIGKTSVDLGFWKNMHERQGWIDKFDAQGRVSGHEVSFSMRDGQNKVFMLSSERFTYGTEECVLTMSVDVTQRKALESDLMELNSNLEQRVAQRTRDLDQSHQELLQTMQTLERAQEELIQSDKLASLGSLVAGVAHELNTPIGNALIAASSMSDEVVKMQRSVAQGGVKRSDFEKSLARVHEGSELTLRSLDRAVALISSFKQVAVDQASERRRDFDLTQVLNEVLDTLKPKLKLSSANLQLDLQAGLMMRSYPVPLGQVIINLFTNALAHGFDGKQSGVISVKARSQGDDRVCITVSDNGAGIAPEHLGQVFDPFFTTKLGRGGSGLGLSVSHRIVTRILGGQISIQSKPGHGATFELNLPILAPDVVA